MAKGEVRERESVNDKIPTGHVEIFVDDLRILAKAQTKVVPIQASLPQLCHSQ